MGECVVSLAGLAGENVTADCGAAAAYRLPNCYRSGSLVKRS